MIIIIMGVAGAGKTTVGRRLAAAVGWRFFDADDFHPAANVAKMARAEPLTDDDRAPWLAALARMLGELTQHGESAVLACSALKADYRVQLQAGGGDMRFVYLRATPALIRQRLAVRRGHYLHPDLLESQFATLQEPADALPLDAALPPGDIIAAIRQALAV